MKARRCLLAAVSALVFFVACDDGPDDELPFRDEGGGGEELAEADPVPTDLFAPSPSVSPTPTATATATPTPTPKPGDTDDPDADEGRDRPRRSKPRFAFPRAGSYTYVQQGYEEFCTTSCASDPLPRDRVMSIGHGRSSRDAISIVETTEVSTHRTSTTVTRHTRGAAVIVAVRDAFEAGDDTFRIGFQPSPPIQALRVPLREGASWNGSWQARTSGEYRIAVQGFDEIKVAGGSYRAARVQVRLEFRGDAEGYLVTTWWVDPRTRVVIASVGSMEVRDGPNRYTTDFDTRLSDGPGYR